MLCASLLLTLCGCADDTSDSMPQHTQELRLSLGYPTFLSADGVTRTDPALPASFELYAHGSSLQPISQIQCYMTYEKDGNKYIPCQFDHVTTTSSTLGHIWTSKVPLYTLASGSYYLYGYMPKENVGSGVTIDPYGTPASFDKGVVMTLTGLNAVTPDDICVIVGAKGYDGSVSNPSIPNMSERLGKFDYYPERDGTSLFLLVDHIYAGLKFNMSLDLDYAALRGIKVKNIKLKPEDGDNDVVETVEAVVTIVANSAEPMKVVFQNFTRGKSPQPAVIYDGEGESLSTTSKAFMACFCPTTNSKFTLETTYDVYDTKGNLIREGQTARNAISLAYDLEAGRLHIVNITVKPTYLYVLSDPDLDSPTFVVGS